MHNKETINIVDSKGLNRDNLGLNALLFYTEDIGFIAGSSDSVFHNDDSDHKIFASVKRTALLYRSTNGGSTWKENNFGSGHFTDISRIGDTLFAFKTSENDSDITIYYSNDKGDNWNKLNSSPEGAYQILAANKSLYIAASSSTKDGAQIFVSTDNASTWKGLDNMKYSIFDKLVSFNDQLFYLHNSIPGNYFPNMLAVYNISDKTAKAIELPKHFNCYFLGMNMDKLILMGVENGHITAYSLKNNSWEKEFSYKDDGDIFIQGFYAVGDSYWIIVGEKETADVKNVIFKTADNGKTWNVIKFVKDNHIKPFYFLDENGKIKAYFFSGNERFQILN